jgi:hypothetical protein
MDRRERTNDLEAAIAVALKGALADLWTGMPGILQSFNAAAMTAVVQPAIQGQNQKQDGSWSNVNLPLLLDCPVQFSGGGGVSLTMPLKKGDEVWINFANRCIDAWWSQGGIQPQAEFRMHDLSDGFCFPKVWSKPNALSNVSTTKAQLRSDDGNTYVELDPTGHIVNIVAQAEINLTSPVIKLAGGVVIDGVMSGTVGGGGTIDLGNANLTSTGSITSQGKDLATHPHGGVQPGGGVSGPPV